MMRECAKAITAIDDWSEAGFLLREFSFPSDSEGPQSLHSFVLDNLASGNEDDLLDLHRHLYPEVVASSQVSVDQGGSWQPGMVRLFVSHVSEDRDVISEMKRVLVTWGVDAFVAHIDIEPTKEWIDEIEFALGTCHALLAYMTPRFHSSLYTDHELGFCLGRGVPIIPVRVGADPYGLIGRFQALRGSDTKPGVLAVDVVRTLAAQPALSTLMVERLVHALEHSQSYDRTRSVMSMIEAVKVWTPDQLRRLEQASVENNQVSNAVLVATRTNAGKPVPDRIREIVARHSR